MKIRCNFTYIKKIHLGLCINSHCFLCTLRSLCFAAERQRWPEPCWRAGISSSPPPQDSNGSRMVPAAWFLAAWFLLPPGSLLDPIPARRGPLLFLRPLRHRRVLGRRFNSTATTSWARATPLRLDASSTPDSQRSSRCKLITQSFVTETEHSFDAAPRHCIMFFLYFLASPGDNTVHLQTPRYLSVQHAGWLVRLGYR